MRPDTSNGLWSRQGRALAGAVAAGIAGDVLMRWTPPLVDGLPLRFDTVLALLTAVAAGPVWGALTAIISTTHTSLQLGHPIMTVVAVLEAVSVGLLVRHRFGPALASLGFWACFGVPLLYLSCAWMLRLDLHVVTMLALKQALNGVANALLLQIVMTWPPVKAWLRGPERVTPAPLRTQIFESFIALAVCPVLVLGIGLGRVFTVAEERDAQQELVERVSIVGARIDEYVSAHERAAQSMAQRLAGAGQVRADVERALLSAHRLYPAFDKLAATDAAGEATGGTHIRRGTPGVMGVTGSIADRVYFSEPMRTGRPYRSDIFLTGDADNAPAVVLSAPLVLGPTTRGGIIKASLNLREVGRIAGDLVELSATTLMVTDDRGVVIAAAGVDAPGALTHVGGSPWVQSTAARGAGEYLAPAEPTRTGPRYLTARFDMPEMRWRVFMRRSVREVQRPAVRFYAVTAGLVVCSLIVAVALAALTAGRVSHPLEQVAAETRAVTSGGLSAWAHPVDPRAPVEVQALQADLEALVARLLERDAQLRQAVADREAAHAELERTHGELDTRVGERTIALADASRRAEQATRAKSEFLANMSHEIRTPMNGVIALAELLVTTPLDAQQRELAQTIHSSGLQLLGVINDILDLSKIESGRLVIEADPFAPRLLLAETAADATATLGTRPVTVRWSSSADVPEWLLGDGLRVRQIVQNLMSNAVKFTARGEVRLRAGIARDERGQPRLRIEVADTGIGIEPDRMVQIFQPFELGDASMTRRFGGTGLGLAISTRLADLMGGQLRAASVPGAGATFTLDLPLHPAAASEVPGREPAGLRSGLPPAEPVRYRVLVADDDAVNRQVAVRLLAYLGQDAQAVPEGASVVAAWDASRDGVLLMDLEMPGVDGLEATRQIRARSGDLQRPWIIGASAHTAADARAGAFAAGMNDYLTKPLTIEALKTALARIVVSDA